MNSKRKFQQLFDYPDSSDEELFIPELEIQKHQKTTSKTASPLNIAGNFPSFIFIEVKNNKIIQLLQSKIQSFFPEIKKCEDLHISLSLNFALNLHQISSFLEKWRKNLSYFKKFYAKALVHDLEIFNNKKSDQLFIVIKLSNPQELHEIIQEIDLILKNYGCEPLFFENYAAHVSLGALKPENLKKFKEKIESFIEKLKNDELFKEQFIEIEINRLVCKVGERLNYLNLV